MKQRSCGAPRRALFYVRNQEGGLFLNVLVVEPDYAPYEKEVNGLNEMQDVVGGLIQAIYPFEEQVAVVCNEEGLLLDMPFNRSMEGGYGAVFGPFFVCGLSEDILPCQIWGHSPGCGCAPSILNSGTST